MPWECILSSVAAIVIGMAVVLVVTSGVNGRDDEN
jgi:hypothetical protein